ncbi:SMP-30/gluconolactonase/LRE family protein [Ahrensia kielensis]|uniref:SMP-30/gluconolactonase/LRE family protein n=1 Tax=Ahrensia kielensis TaxID=76980 RepID=A0ABU9TAF4_9HYPH
MDALCVVDSRTICGEGPVWDHRSGLLWWVDIAGELFNSFDPVTKITSNFNAPCLVSGLCLAPGGFLVASAQGIAHLNPVTKSFKPLHAPEPMQKENRLNDMVVDKYGRLWAGTMSKGAKAPQGALYCYDASGCHVIANGFTVANGSDFSPDNRTFYIIDSKPRHIRTYDVSDAGEISNQRIFYTFDENDGLPDGLCIDSVGTLWIAMCGKGAVLGLSPDGKIIARIELAVPKVTSCAFGGADLKTLYMTTGTFGLDDRQLTKAPNSGGLFAVQMASPGRKQIEALWPSIESKIT